MTVKIIKQKISQKELEEIASNVYGIVVKIAVDIQLEILVLGGEFHADCEAVLIKNGSKPADIWGANILLNKPKNDRLEFVALINMRPMFNRSMEIQEQGIKDKIRQIVDKLIQ